MLLPVVLVCPPYFFSMLLYSRPDNDKAQRSIIIIETNTQYTQLHSPPDTPYRDKPPMFERKKRQKRRDADEDNDEKHRCDDFI